MPDQTRSRIPIVTIGGFLGSGKTTLINHLLRQTDDQRIVVFVNDFGAISIDYDLIETADTNRISLTNGCVCCTLNDDLISSLKLFMDDTDRPDAFVIEASGIADPRALDRSIALLEQSGSVRFDNRIYIVDADQFLNAGFEDAETIIDHAAAADLVLLNKQDLAAAADLQSLDAVFAGSAPNSTVLHTCHCRCSLELILGQRLSSNGVFTTENPVEPLSGHHGFVSWSRETKRKLDRSKFEQFVKYLAATSYRAKGRIFFQNQTSRPGIFNMVGRRAVLEMARSDDAEQISQIVAIGKANSLDKTRLESWFEEMLR